MPEEVALMGYKTTSPTAANTVPIGLVGDLGDCGAADFLGGVWGEIVPCSPTLPGLRFGDPFSDIVFILKYVGSLDVRQIYVAAWKDRLDRTHRARFGSDSAI